MKPTTTAHTAETNSARHMGGSLLAHYRTIGEALLAYEAATSGMRLRGTRDEALSAFRAAVSFVGIEVLQSYFEDLLDPRIDDDSIFLRDARRDRAAVRNTRIFAAMVFVAFGLTFFRPATLPFVSLAIAVVGAAMLALNFSSSDGLARRMELARVVHAEILRRRGQSDDDDMARNLPRVKLLRGGRDGEFEACPSA